MSTVRAALAAALAAALPAPEWRVTGHGRSVDRIEVDQHVVMLTTERWSRPDVALSLVPVRLQLYVLTGITDPDRVEDALDAALVTVLDALHPIDYIEWTEAERVLVQDDTFHAYRVDLVGVQTITPEPEPDPEPDPEPIP